MEAYEPRTSRQRSSSKLLFSFRVKTVICASYLYERINYYTADEGRNVTIRVEGRGEYLT
jgi:hypothetical protein